ncbi:hypothetical protein OTK49_02425 [Vibrio coralliirubri]|uniref:hypothetical protein n=1 Tax=Vibrio coralliirubri TaxID=1516159 RepID=UPI00228415CF|nr:hypothetical protein [Vibrio coralliirubri]MCY9861372.1 hypothetical protein [Vibrio coralliirubri]
MIKSSALIPLELSDLTKKRMIELNGEGYKAGDIRTYKVMPLAHNPAKDIEIHENLKPLSGMAGNTMSTVLGSVGGTAHSNSMQQASNKVFHFPKASGIDGALLVRKVDVETPYPMWMINRYGLESFRGDLTHTQSTNIYVDKRSGLFYILFDEAFLNGVAFEDLTTGLSKDELELVSIANGKSGRYFRISTRNLVDITGRNRDAQFSIVKQKVIDAYTSLFITKENTTKVICISIKSKYPDTTPFFVHGTTSSILSSLVRSNGAAMDLSFVVAAERQGKFYPIKEDGSIEASSPFHFRRRHADSEISSLRSDKEYQYGDYIDEQEFSKESTLIIPYTEEDHSFIKGVVDRLNSVKMDLINFFKSSETRGDSGDSAMTLAIEHYKGASSILALGNK